MKDFNQIIKDIESLDFLLIKLSRKDPEAVSKLNKLHANVFGKPIDGNCPNCIQRAYKTLRNLTIENLEIMEAKKFELKKGKLIRIAYTGEAYSNTNLTDAKAIQLLKDRPERISLFKKFPADWKGEKKATKPEKKEEAKWSDGLKQADLKAIYAKEVGEVPKSIKNIEMISAIEAQRAIKPEGSED